MGTLKNNMTAFGLTGVLLWSTGHEAMVLSQYQIEPQWCDVAIKRSTGYEAIVFNQYPLDHGPERPYRSLYAGKTNATNVTSTAWL